MKNILKWLLLFFTGFAFAQDYTEIKIEDIAKEYNKVIIISTFLNDSYLDGRPILDSVKSFNNEYVIKLNNKRTNSNDIPIPYYLVLKTEDKNRFNLSEIFYVGNKKQLIKFNSQSGSINFTKENLLYNDIIRFKLFFEKIENQKKDLGKIYFSAKKTGDTITQNKMILEKSKIQIEEDKLLILYAEQNSKSYVLFWNLVNKFHQFGYSEEIEYAFNKLDNKIRTSIFGKKLFNEIAESKKLIVGNNFNVFPLYKKNEMIIGKKFTLIDFWFSYCSPCISEIPKSKLIYDEYKKKGFEYIAISTDRTKDITNWKKVIEENKLTWYNLLDENGKEAKKYNINSFPTNFLLNSEGTIIQKNISPENLKIFLEQNLR